MNDYIKLGALVGDKFTVEDVGGFKWKSWDNLNNKPLVSDDYHQGYQKKYQVTTDKGLLDLSTSQLGNMLESVSSHGRSDVSGITFNVKSNGKMGMEIRYYLNPVTNSTLDDAYDSES